MLLNGEWVEVYRQRPLAEYRYLSGREPIEVEISLEAALSVLFDAVVIPNGAVAITTLATQGHAFEFVKDQYRHCKPIVALGAGRELLEKAGVPAELSSGEADPGVLRFSGIVQKWHCQS